MQPTLILAAIYNIGGGVAILFLLGLLSPVLHFEDTGQPLFRLFAGGTAVLFGAAYLAVAKDFKRNRPLMVYGTVLKYWAFGISLYLFLAAKISVIVLLGFGGGNLVFALLFTYLLLRAQQKV